MGVRAWVVAAAVLGSGIVFLDSSVVAVAVPRIGETLPAYLLGVLEGQSYIYTGYLLALSALLIPAGAVTDSYGRRRTFALGLAGFGFTSVLCGLAPTMEWLVVFRVLQGGAGALLVPGSLSLIRATHEGEAQGRAFGIWAGASGLTTILGPVVGGLLIDVVSWRAVFLVNVPLVALALWVTGRYVPESRDERAAGRPDWRGTLVGTLAVGGLTFGLIYGQQRQWGDAVAAAALFVGGVAAVAFPWLMRRTPHALVPPALFRSRAFTVVNLATFLIYGALYVILYYVPLFMQGTLGYSAAAAGVGIVPATAFLVLFSSRVGAAAARRGPRGFMAAGPALMALATLWFARVGAGSLAWVLDFRQGETLVPSVGYLVDFLPGLVVFGVGLALMVAPLTTCLMRAVPARHAGVGSAVNNAISRVGPQFAGAVVFVLVTTAFYEGVARRVPTVDVHAPGVRASLAPLNRPATDAPGVVQSAAREASAAAFRRAMAFSAALLAAGAVVSAVGIRNPQPQGGATLGAARRTGAR